MVASSRTYYSLKDSASSSGHTRQKTRASQAPHLVCQVLPYKLSEHTIPGLLNAIHYWILQIQPTAGPRVAELHRHPRGWLKLELKCSRRRDMGQGYRGFMELASIFKVRCHLHHTRLHFPVVCCLLAKVFQA